MAEKEQDFSGDPLERYMKNLPLNAEIAAVRKPVDVGREMQEQMRQQWQVSSEDEDLLRVLTKEERGKLLKLRAQEGWPVLERLLKRALQIHHNTAINVSQQQPLKNREAIADEWHTVVTYKRLVQELLMQVDGEIKQLTAEGTRAIPESKTR